METGSANTQKHKLEEDDSAPANKQEDVPTKKNKTQQGVDNEKKHTITTEPAPWVSSQVTLSPSQYIKDFLKSVPALSIIKERGPDNVFSVHANHHAGQALSLMAKENLLSCPVYDKELEANVGFVDYMDLTSLLVDVIHKVMKDDFPDVESLASLDSEQRHRLISLTKTSFNSKTLFDISVKLLQPVPRVVPVRSRNNTYTIADLSKLDPYNAVPKGASLYQAIELLAKSGIHRVPIENDEQKIEAILSQSTVIDYLFNNLEKFPSKAKVPVPDITGPDKLVFTVKEDDLAFTAFERMIEHKVTAVGILDENNKLSGVISSTDRRDIVRLSALYRRATECSRIPLFGLDFTVVVSQGSYFRLALARSGLLRQEHKDLRMIGPHAHTVGALLHSTKEFYEKARELNKWTVLPVVTTSYDETLGIVIEKMQDNFVHRVFVVDEQGAPVSVISMKDILMQFV